MDLRAAVAEHERLVNDAVRSGDFTAFLATFADDAVMSFDELPIGPFRGREAIRQAYAAEPPTDTITTRAIEQTAPEAAAVRIDWSAGGTGAMRLGWRDGQVSTLAVAFDD